MNDFKPKMSRRQEPLSALQGEREGPNPPGWEGEVGGAADQHVGPPHPALSPGRRGERVKRASLECARTGLKLNQPFTVAEFFGLL